MSVQAPKTIEYAPPLRWHQRRRAPRIIALFVIVIVLLPAAWNWRFAWRQVRYVWLRRQLAHFVIPSDKVAFEADPQRAQTLLNTDPEYRREMYGSSSPSNLTVASWLPTKVAEFSALSAPGSGVNFRAQPPVVFAGDRELPGGKRVLLVLRFEGYVTFGSQAARVYTFYFDLYGRHVERDADVATRMTTLLEHGYFDRLYAAQADPTDRSHVWFRYVINGEEGIIDAWLKQDATMEMKVRTGPAATQPAK